MIRFRANFIGFGQNQHLAFSKTFNFLWLCFAEIIEHVFCRNLTQNMPKSVLFFWKKVINIAERWWLPQILYSFLLFFVFTYVGVFTPT